MVKLRLVHPKYGIVSEREITGRVQEFVIKRDWKHRYGKKYLECLIESDPATVNHRKSLLNRLFQENGFTYTRKSNALKRIRNERKISLAAEAG